MSAGSGLMRRRALLRVIGAGLAGSAMVRPGFAGSPAIIADQDGGSRARYNILVGGPHGGRMDRWARASALGMRTALSAHAPIQLRTVGGQDGVTGANRLQTLVVPNGQTAAILPGEASIAFLAGDPRVHFQPGDWIQVMAGLSAALLILRGGLGRLSESAPIRLAAASPESPDLAALLAFQRLGASVVPIFGLRGAAAVARAFAAGEADAVLLTGEEIPADAAPLAAEGGIPVGTLGIAGESGDIVRDPLFPHLPTIHEIADNRGAPGLSQPLDQAYRAVAAASRIDFMLVLPHLTTSAKVAIWRQAAVAAVASPALQSAAAASAISLTADGGAASALAPLDLPSGALLALREFMFQRLGWRPS
ncbi:MULTISPECIES: hypothetical protein [Acidiphilium]|uniref:Uncharacterized protein n=1 Tax=Acidiphilium iwatense TaxID=768198 RepID=A0ABS9DT13_9PROT|nr:MULTISPECIES: hypothetical protein [Acidiphilium]MCF3945874.1 hypothetical protein [Acidiphilium iwatense]